MSELGEDARSLLAKARGGHEAASGAKERVRAGLAVSLAASGGAGATLPRLVARGRWLVVAKGGTAVAILAVGAAVLLNRGKDAREHVTALPAATAAAPVEPIPSPSVPPAAATATAGPAAPATSAIAPAAPRAPAASMPRPVPTASGGSVAAEVALLRRVSASLRAGDPESALAGVDEHARRFPSGALAEERDVERIVALCALDRRDEAARATARFHRAYPTSSHEARIRAACASAAPSGVAP